MPRSSVLSDKFWLDDLEFDPVEARARFDDDAREQWVQKRTGRQAQVLCEALGIEAHSTFGRKQLLLSAGAALDPYFLVSAFGSGRGEVAVRDHAERALPADVMTACSIGPDRIDKMAVLFALFHQRRFDLKTVRLLDKIHKSGFAPMALATSVRQPSLPIGDFLKPATIRPFLTAVDREAKDHRTSHLREVLHRNGRWLVFIRRADRARFGVKAGGAPAPCYDSDIMAIDFGTDARKIGIAARTPVIAVEIANAVASAYFRKACRYENEQNAIPRATLAAFLKHLYVAKEGQVVLVELTGTTTGLPGAPQLTICQHQSSSIGEAVETLEDRLVPFQLEDIDSLKIVFKRKRVTLVIEPTAEGDAFSLRYSDFRLNLLERADFESYMREVHQITILSTEKQRVRAS